MSEVIYPIFEKAADLIEEIGWCQGDYAKDKNGNGVSYRDDEAASFCLIGAIGRVKLDMYYRNCDFSGSFAIVEALISLNVARWNDALERKKEDVVSLLRNAARRVRYRE